MDTEFKGGPGPVLSYECLKIWTVLKIWIYFFCKEKNEKALWYLGCIAIIISFIDLGGGKIGAENENFWAGW